MTLTTSASPPSAEGRPLDARRFWLAGAAAAVLLVYGELTAHLPRFSYSPGLTAMLVINCVLLGLLLYGLAPLCEAGLWALVVAAAGLVGAVAFSFAGLTVPASLCKVVGASSLGFWLVGSVTSTNLVVVIAALAAVVDIVSVAMGPTRALLRNAPSAVGALTVALLWPGYGADVGYTALGVSDVIFMALYIGAAVKFGLRVRTTVVACLAGVAITVIAATHFSALPVLPLLGVAFVGVNADLLFWRRRPTPPAAPSAGEPGRRCAGEPERRCADETAGRETGGAGGQ